MGNILTSIGGNSEYNDKCREYYLYIMNHINNVKLAYNKLFDIHNIDKLAKGLSYTYNEMTSILAEVHEEIQHHDESKFCDIEFEPYRRKFYPTSDESAIDDIDILQMVESNFDDAWRHHYMFNDHHPNFYVYNYIKATSKYGKPIDWTSSREKIGPSPMSIVSILHMICDWEAMSMNFKGNTIDWYKNKADKEKQAFHRETRSIVDKVLSIIYEVPIEELK